MHHVGKILFPAHLEKGENTFTSNHSNCSNLWHKEKVLQENGHRRILKEEYKGNYTNYNTGKLKKTIHGNVFFISS